MNRKITLLVIAAIVVPVFWTVFRSACGKSTEIVIISTNDMHGAIDRMPALAGLVCRYRSSERNVLLVDAGDKWTGNPYVDGDSEPGRPIVDLMNSLGYAFATIGNHGFDRGGRTLDGRVRDGAFCTVLANMRSDSAYLDDLPAYACVEIEGVKLCFVGLIDNSRNGFPDSSPVHLAGLHFDDPLAAARRFRWLRDSCDVLIALTHIGAGQDSLLALEMPELDMIVGGHSHTVLPRGTKVNGVLLTQAGKGLHYAGVTRLRWRFGRLVGRENKLVLLDTVTPDPAMADRVERIKNGSVLRRAAGSVASSMDRTALANWMSDAIREAGRADIGLCNRNGIRTDSLPSGELAWADLYAMEPFGNRVYLADMRLQDLGELILRKFNEPGEEGGTVDICPSGIRYAVDTDAQGRGCRVRFYDERGDEMLAGERTFRVAMSDFIGETYDFARKGQGRRTDIRVADALGAYLRGRSPMTVSCAARASIGQRP